MAAILCSRRAGIEPAEWAQFRTFAIIENMSQWPSHEQVKSGEWFVYILRCCDDSLYVGISNDVEERVKRHNAGMGAAYTRSHRPVVLVWTEKAESESGARKREIQIKGWMRIKKLNLITYGHPNASTKEEGKCVFRLSRTR